MKVTDPVCGMQIDPEQAAGKFEYAGVTYWFCSQACRRQFVADPAKYVAAANARRQPSGGGC